MNSTFGNRPGVDADTALLHLSGPDALARGIQTGDRVRVFNDRGSLRKERLGKAVQPL